MGLLDDFPLDGWRGLLGAPINRAPLLVPLMEATDNIGSHQYQPTTASPLASAVMAPINGAGRSQPAGTDGWVPRQLPPQHLTIHALRMKGVPEPHIAAATDNPELMRHLIYRNFGHGSATTDGPSGPTGIDGNRCAWPSIDPLHSMDATGSLADDRLAINPLSQVRDGFPEGQPGTLSSTLRNSSVRNVANPALVQLAQYRPARPALPIPPLFSPGTSENKEWTDGFIASNMRAGRTIGDWLRGIFHNDENVVRPPPGSRPINETPWSGDHTEIKDAVGTTPKGNVKISPDGDVWVQNRNGSWTNHGPAENFTGSGKPRGRRETDRD